MKKLLIILPLLLLLSGCSWEKDFGKEFNCGDYKGILIGETEKQIQILSNGVWVVQDKITTNCVKLPFKGLKMLTGYEDNWVNFNG